MLSDGLQRKIFLRQTDKELEEWLVAQFKDTELIKDFEILSLESKDPIINAISRKNTERIIEEINLRIKSSRLKWLIKRLLFQKSKQLQ